MFGITAERELRSMSDGSNKRLIPTWLVVYFGHGVLWMRETSESEFV